jgi:hypothetical protein
MAKINMTISANQNVRYILVILYTGRTDTRKKRLRMRAYQNAFL